MKKILVTGGAGFIGSHLIDFLLEKGHLVVCIDDLSLGRPENISHNINNQMFKFIELDLLKKKKLLDIFKENKFDSVFHLAANSDISKGTKKRDVDLKRNFITTFNVLECMKIHQVNEIIFSSTSAIYGEPKEKISENLGPLFPISLYGASKLASEGYISAYSNLYDIKAWIVRFPNVVGERTTHGVIFDFIKKLNKNPKKLLVLGDGEQRKPYIYVRDLIEAIYFSWTQSSEKLNYFNLGCDSSTSVKEIASIVISEMGLLETKISYTMEKRGWPGDVPLYSYDLAKINNLGWTARFTSNEAVRISVKKILGKQ